MKHACALIALLLLHCSLRGQTDTSAASAPVAKIRQIIFGMNYLPLLYAPVLVFDRFNQLPYGYHLGYCSTDKRRVTLRSGFDLNAFTGSGQSKDRSIAFELGIERGLLKRDSKWLLNIGFLEIMAWEVQRSRDGSGGSSEVLQSLNMGPVLLFGGKLNAHWQLFTEANITFSPYRLATAGSAFEAQRSLYTFRALGLGLRYRFSPE